MIGTEPKLPENPALDDGIDEIEQPTDGAGTDANACAIDRPRTMSAVNHADNTVSHQSGTKLRKALRGRPFPPGISGNARGRPLGARNKISAHHYETLLAAGEEIIAKFIEGAAAGKPLELKLALARLFPVDFEPPLDFALPSLNTAQDCSVALNATLQAFIAGNITHRQMESINATIEKVWRHLDLTDLEDRLRRLELAQGR